MTDTYNEEDFAKFCLEISTKKFEDFIASLANFNGRFPEVFETKPLQLQKKSIVLNLPKLRHKDDILTQLYLHFNNCLQRIREESDVSLIPSSIVVVKFLTILCRSPENLRVVSTSNLTDIILQMCNILTTITTNLTLLVSFSENVLFFLECQYDPTFRGRYSFSKAELPLGEAIAGNTNSSSFPAPIQVRSNVKVFIIELMQLVNRDINTDEKLTWSVQCQAAGLFTAIILGDNENAAQIICPASVDTIFKVMPKLHTVHQGPAFCHALSVIVWKLSSLPPEKRQVDISSVIACWWDLVYFAKDEYDVNLLLTVVEQMITTMNGGRKFVQQSFVAAESFKKLNAVFEEIASDATEFCVLLKRRRGKEVMMVLLKLLKSLLHDNLNTKNSLEKEIGHESMFATLCKCGDYPRAAWHLFFSMVVECPIEDCPRELDEGQIRNVTIKNVNVVPCLLRMAQSIADDAVQRWVSATLLNLCLSSWHNKLVCVQHGIVTRLISIFHGLPKEYNPTLIDDFFEIFENLACISMTSEELKRLIAFFEPKRHSSMIDRDSWFIRRFLKSVQHVASSSDSEKFQFTYWDFSLPNCGIVVDNSFVLAQPGFTLRAWVKFNRAHAYKNNFHLYTMTTATSNKFDVFFDENCSLTVSMAQQNFVSRDTPVNDGQWHCIDICHSPQRGLFGSSLLVVYVDGIQHLSLAAAFPFYSENITECKMGYSSHLKLPFNKASSLDSNDIEVVLSPSRSASNPTIQNKPTSRIMKLFRAPSKATPSSPQNKDSIKIVASPVSSASLVGSIVEVMIFNEVLSANQIVTLYKAGLDLHQRSYVENEDVGALLARPLLWYNAKASSDAVCYDLSKSTNNGKVVASKCIISSVKNLLNSVGGIQVILAIMDQFVEYACNVELGLKEYLDLLRHMINGHLRNQENFVKCDGMAILAVILTRVNANYVDLRLFKSLTDLLQAVSNHQILHQQMISNIFFNFRTWSRVHRKVVSSLMDTLQQIIGSNKAYYRKKYGVQFFLDAYVTYISEKEKCDDEDCLKAMEKIRESFCNVIKFYVSSGLTPEESWEILGAFCHYKTSMSLDLADMLIKVLESASKSDPIFSVLCEPKRVELIYALLTSSDHSNEFKEKIIKIIDLLLQNAKVLDAAKASLRILETEYGQGFVHLLMDTNISAVVVEWCIDQLFYPDAPPNVKGILSITRLCSSTNSLRIRTKFMQKLIAALHSKPSIIKALNETQGWSSEFLKLLIMNKISADNGKNPTKGIKPPTISPPPHEGPVLLSPPILYPELSHSFNRQIEAFNQTDLSAASSLDDPYATSHPIISRQGSINSHGSGASSPHTSSPLPNPSIAFPLMRQNLKVLEASQYCKYVGLTASKAGLSTTGMSSSEEMVVFVLLFIYELAWKTPDDAVVDDTAWKIREETLVAIEEASKEQGLITDENLSTKFFVILTHSCHSDYNHRPTSSRLNIIKNTILIYKHLYGFMSANKSKMLFSERLLQNIVDLNALMITPSLNVEYRQPIIMFEIAYLLMFISQQNYQVCTLAVTNLHEVMHERPPMGDFERACYILATLSNAMDSSDSSDFLTLMLPLMTTLLDLYFEILGLASALINLPRPREEEEFFQIFRNFRMSRAWKEFISNVVKPASAQYKSNVLDSLAIAVTNGKVESRDNLVVARTRRNRETLASASRVTSNHLSLLQSKDIEERSRLKVLAVHDKTKEEITANAWKQAKKIFYCESGFWPSKSKESKLQMIAPCENYVRMRPKVLDIDSNSQQPIMSSQLPGNLSNVFSDLKALQMMKDQDDQLNDDEWEKLKTFIALAETKSDNKGTEKMIHTDCELVTVFDNTKGQLDVTPTHIIFRNSYSNNSANSEASFQTPLSIMSMVDVIKVPLDQLKEIHFRRYNLQRSALELFFINQSSYFFNFGNTEIRNKLYADIIRLRPSNLIKYVSRSPVEFIRGSGLTQQWIQREISNFEYLMHLNTISGRTYNDLSQYPVFPWVLSDYTSSSLDFNDPKIYRDLSWPVGALNPNNRGGLKEKFTSLMEQSADKKDWFHYGTHYSNPAGVMHYLVRLEPFTSLHLQLQGGSFDVPDRQFNSIASTWNVLMSNPNDVKELIPEFFYLPEFFRNTNNLKVGKLQGGTDEFDDVILPPWSRSPSDFVHKHMDALESDYVSENLNNWIDLIFGYKQRGQDAIASLNVFHYCTYEGSVDLDAITSPTMRKACEDCIKNFGQTPAQLFKEPHPKRLTIRQWLGQTSKLDRTLNFFNCPKLSKINTLKVAPQDERLVFISSSDNNLVVLTENGLVGIHTWHNHDKNIPNQFTLTPDPSMSNYKTQKRLASSFCLVDKTTYKLFAMIPNSKLLMSCGHWDSSLRVYNLSKFKQVAHVTCRTDVITCLALDRIGRKLVTGSLDGTCLVWDVFHKDSKVETLAPMKLLCGHTAAVSCVALSCDLDVVVSGSKDGTIIIYNLGDGSFSRYVRPPRTKATRVSIEHLAMSEFGYLCVYCVHIDTRTSNPEPDQLMLHMYTINGRHLSVIEVSSPVTSVAMHDRFALVGFENGDFHIKRLFGKDTEFSTSFHAPVTSICLTERNGHVLVGLDDCSLKVFQLSTS